MRNISFKIAKSRLGFLILFFFVISYFNVNSSFASCLTFSDDGLTVTGTDGTCTVVTAADFGFARDVANDTRVGNTYVGTFTSSKDTLTSVEFPSGFTRIASGAFRDCAKLESVTIPKTVDRIHANAFSRCTSLSSVNIPSSVKIIGNNAFQYCTSLGNIIIPDTVESIGNYTYRGCNANILFSNKNATVGISAFSDNVIYCYEDSSWVNSSVGGALFYLITSILSTEDSISINNYSSKNISLTTQPIVSLYDIPSIKYSSSNPSIAEPQTATTGKGVTTNTINSGAPGNAVITITASQVGSDIFGEDAVPAIPSAEIQIEVLYYNCINFSEDGTTVTGTDGTCVVIEAEDFENATSIAADAITDCNYLEKVTIPSNITNIGESAFGTCDASILYLNKTATVENYAFGDNDLYCYQDSTWNNDNSGGNKRYIIGSISLSEEPVVLDKGIQSSITIVSDQPDSEQYIPGIKYTIANTEVAELGLSATGKGVLTNQIKGKQEDSTFLTITAKQIGSDIFSEDAVPPISTKTVSVTVIRHNCLVFSDDGLTVTGTDGRCVEVTAADFGNATDIADQSNNTGVFTSSSNTLTSVEIPSGFTRIASGAFRGCFALNEVTIPDTVESIDPYAFYDCTSLLPINFSANLKSIGQYAFNGCTFDKIIIPSTITSIGDGAFRFCNSDILITSKTTSVSYDAFLYNTVYCYADSDWTGLSGGDYRYFITDVSIDDVNVPKGISTNIPVTANPALQYIPSVTWNMSDNTLGKFVYSSTVNNLSFISKKIGTSSVELTFKQAGSDIFGEENVPAIAPANFTLTVYQASSVRSDSSAFYNDGTAPGRLFLNSKYSYTTTAIYTAFRVYVKEGETVYLGTSSFGNTTDILVKYPDGHSEAIDVYYSGNCLVYDGINTFTYSSLGGVCESAVNYCVNRQNCRVYAKETSEAGPGLIMNIEQEQAGPSVLSSDGKGYKPYVINITQEGYLDVLFYPYNGTGPGSYANYNDEFIHNQAGVNLPVGVAAWDITVVGTDGNKVNGRVFTDHFSFFNNSVKNVKFAGYILTSDGNIYHVDTGAMNGLDWYFFANSRGIIHTSTNSIFYGSIFGCFLNDQCIDKTASIKGNFSSRITTDLDFTPDANGDVMFRLFVNYPDEDLLEYLGLSEPLKDLTISDFDFMEDTTNGGGTFSFVSNHNMGSYNLYIEPNDDTTGERTVLIGNTIRENVNTIYWNGKDNQGNAVDIADCKFKLRVVSGETHILFDDIEYLHDGLKVINLTSDTGSSQVHYNNSNITIDNENNRMNQFLVNSQAQITPTDMEMYGGNLVASSNKNNILLYGEPNQINGIDTYSYSAMKTANRYSDMTTMNVWFYGDIAEEEFGFDKIKIEKEWNDEMCLIFRSGSFST